MLSLSPTIRILLCAEPADLRKSFDGLSTLPRDRRVYELSEAERLCQCCGQARVVIGQEVSEQLDYEPAPLMVIEHARLTYACPACEKQRQAGTPAAPTAAATTNTATGSFSAAALNDPAT
jgi:transposase